MPEIKEVKLVQVTMRLGNNPRFTIHADTHPNSNPGQAKFHCQGAGDEGKELCAKILKLLRDAYPDGESINVTVDGSTIIA